MKNVFKDRIDSGGTPPTEINFLNSSDIFLSFLIPKGRGGDRKAPASGFKCKQNVRKKGG